MHKEEATAAACPEDNGKGVSGTTPDGQYDPWNPPYPPRDPGPPGDFNAAAYFKSVNEWMDKTGAILANSRATNIIIPDRTPQCINDELYDKVHIWEPILDKDSVVSFLRFFNQNGRGMCWGFVFTPETFNQMVVCDALRCAKLVLVGKDPKLHGLRVNPNYMTKYGFFPIHRTADMFSVDMIELLLRHGASANLRTSGDAVTGNLLPLHVAVENTCLHKYLEDGLNPNQGRVDCSQADINYILKLIHILCLPEMKIFLDTTRVLAKHTDNLLDELCKYIVDGKIVHTGVLLLAAQKQIRGLSSRKEGGTSKRDGFGTIINYVVGDITTIKFEMCQNRLEMEPLKVKKRLLDATLDLVHIIFKAVEALDAYIRSHPKVSSYVMKVPDAKVFEHVTLILKDYGFCSTGVNIDIENLFPYKDVLHHGERPHKLEEMVRIEEGWKMPKDKVKKDPRGWELKLARRSFFPYWRSVITSMVGGSKREYPDGSKTYRNKVGIQQAKVNYQPRRMFGAVALTLFKALRKA